MLLSLSALFYAAVFAASMFGAYRAALDATDMQSRFMYRVGGYASAYCFAFAALIALLAV